MAVLQQLLHKQQVEYSEAINSFHKKIDFADKVAQDNREVNQMNVKLAGELEDYRSQTKIFIQDMKQKDEEIMALKQALARRPSGNSEVSLLSYCRLKVVRNQSLINYKGEEGMLYTTIIYSHRDNKIQISSRTVLLIF